MIPTLLYIVAGLLAAPILSYLLLGEYDSGLIAMVALMVIYGGGWVMSVVARHVDQRPTWKPPKRKPWIKPWMSAAYPLPFKRLQISGPAACGQVERSGE